MGFGTGWGEFGKFCRINWAVLCISISAAVAAEIKVALVTPTGQPGAAGLTVRLLCGGEPKAEAPWNGEPLAFKPDGCPAAQIEAGYPQASSNKIQGFVRVAVSLVDPSAGEAVANLAVPELVRVQFHTIDLAHQPERGFWAGLKDMEFEAREGAQAPRKDCLIGQTAAICYFPPGRYRLMAGPPEEIAAVELDGRSLPPVETGDPNAWGTVELEGSAADLAIVLRQTIALRGQVVDEQEKGVPGIQLSTGHRVARSDREGRFELQMDPFPQNIRFADPEGIWVLEPESLQIFDEEQASQPQKVRAKKDDRPALLLSFVDKKERPVGDLRVKVVWCPQEGKTRTERWLNANPEGRLRVPCVPDCEAEFEVQPAGRFLAWKSWKEPRLECPVEKKIVLDEGRFIEGRVVDRWRKPAVGITLRTVGTQVFGVTDVEGKFSIGPVDEGMTKLVLGGKEEDKSLAGMVLARRNPGKNEEPFPVETDVPEQGIPPFLELELVQGGSICLAVESGGQARPLLKALRIFSDPSAKKPVVSSFRTQGKEEAKDPSRICTGLFPGGKYFIEIGQLWPGFRKVWWPGLVRREEATPVGVKAGSVLELGTLRVIPSGSINLVPPPEAIPSHESAGELTFELKEVFLDEEGRELPPGERPPEWEAVPSELVELGQEGDDKNHRVERVRLHGVAEGTYKLRIMRQVTGHKEPLIWDAPDPIQVKVGQWSTVNELEQKAPAPVKE